MVCKCNLFMKVVILGLGLALIATPVVGCGSGGGAGVKATPADDAKLPTNPTEGAGASTEEINVE